MNPEEFPNPDSTSDPLQSSRGPSPEKPLQWGTEGAPGDTAETGTNSEPASTENPFSSNWEESSPSEAAEPSTGIPLNLSWGSNLRINPPIGSSSASGSSASSSPASSLPVSSSSDATSELEQRLASLRLQEQQLKQDIANLQDSYNRMARDQAAGVQNAVEQLIKDSLNEMEQRKQTLQLAVEQLERRQERIKAEMRTTFAGTSQDLAVRVQGFKDYLVGSLQDLVTAVEETKLSVPQPPPQETRRSAPSRDPEEVGGIPKFAEQTFEKQNRQIRQLLDQYRTSPDYYGPSWQLRRTFEPIHADRVANWFFTQGGRGAIRTMGSRLQNILVASASISILRQQYGDRVRVLVLSDLPERLGEWRRGLQDCLGISRSDFGSDQGVVLFEAPEPLAQRADRLMKQKMLPLIIIDESEDVVSLSLLQFPLWLAFASDPQNPPSYKGEY